MLIYDSLNYWLGESPGLVRAVSSRGTLHYSPDHQVGPNNASQHILQLGTSCTIGASGTIDASDTGMAGSVEGELEHGQQTLSDLPDLLQVTVQFIHSLHMIFNAYFLANRENFDQNLMTLFDKTCCSDLLKINLNQVILCANITSFSFSQQASDCLKNCQIH